MEEVALVVHQLALKVTIDVEMLLGHTRGEFAPRLGECETEAVHGVGKHK